MSPTPIRRRVAWIDGFASPGFRNMSSQRGPENPAVNKLGDRVLTAFGTGCETATTRLGSLWMRAKFGTLSVKKLNHIFAEA